MNKLVTSVVVGRKQELSLLDTILASDKAELVAVYGRRRIGKTYIIRNYCADKGLYLEVCGIKDGTTADQLAIFTSALQKAFYSDVPLKNTPDWIQAFRLLTREIKKRSAREKIILFIDELPWLATPRSRLMQNLDHFWNTEWSKFPNLKVILCGSAASWMIDHLINAKGGLHNRLTRIIPLKPFTLTETKLFLDKQHVQMENYNIIELYMALGGVPLYLQQAQKGFSAGQTINRICFHNNGLLFDEFNKLFPALFNSPEIKYRIVRAIAANRYGISRNSIMAKTRILDGGRLTSHLKELEEAGFIACFTPLDKQSKHAWYRVIDEYIFFYLAWISKAPKGIFASSRHDYWNLQRNKPAWHSWSGLAFESICLKHLDLISSALGITSVPYRVGPWTYRPTNPNEKGVQIDLLFDRADGVITICEIKYNSTPFQVTAKYAAELDYKKQIVKKHFAGRKQVSIALITAGGLAPNPLSNRLITNHVNLTEEFYTCTRAEGAIEKHG